MPILEQRGKARQSRGRRFHKRHSQCERRVPSPICLSLFVGFDGSRVRRVLLSMAFDNREDRIDCVQGLNSVRTKTWARGDGGV